MVISGEKPTHARVHRWASDKDERRTQNNMPASDRGCTESITITVLRALRSSGMMRSVDCRIIVTVGQSNYEKCETVAPPTASSAESAEWGEIDREGSSLLSQMYSFRVGVLVLPPPLPPPLGERGWQSCATARRAAATHWRHGCRTESATGLTNN